MSKVAVNAVYQSIRRAIDTAPRNGYVAELHLQVIKYAEVFEDTSGREFCEAMKLAPAWGTEFTKMKKIAARLRQAGMNPERI